MTRHQACPFIPIDWLLKATVIDSPLYYLNSRPAIVDFVKFRMIHLLTILGLLGAILSRVVGRVITIEEFIVC